MCEFYLLGGLKNALINGLWMLSEECPSRKKACVYFNLLLKQRVFHFSSPLSSLPWWPHHQSQVTKLEKLNLYLAGNTGPTTLTDGSFVFEFWGSLRNPTAEGARGKKPNWTCLWTWFNFSDFSFSIHLEWYLHQRKCCKYIRSWIKRAPGRWGLSVSIC